jgi:Ca-activated chloride channel family protein
MRNILIALLSIMLIPLVAGAQTADRPNTILVLDASGSMWGQIDGVNKIVIARDVIAEMLADMPDDAALGLTVYGHRERGNCADIETLIAPAPFTQDAIMAAVNAINPRGRTPMTAAVVEAARALRSTEEPATVILVSDGIETCEADPCAIAAELEAAGIAFTAHVVGFDVADPAARAQMQCIADNTGGMFLTANNAEELASALEQVVMAPAAPPPPPPVVEITFTARIGGAEGPLITDPVLWDIAPLPENVTADTEGNPLVYDMGTGSYTVTAYWTVQEVAETVQFVVTDAPREIAVIFAAPLPQATITAPATAAAGSTIEVGWTGPNYAGDFIGVGMADAEGGARWQNYTRTADGSPLMLEMPAEPGQYLIRYFIDQDRQIIAEVPITLTEVLASITAPATAVAGATLEIGWTGPNYAGDFIGVGMANAEGGAQWQNYTRTADGSPLSLQMPAEPGQYLIRYFIDQDRQIIAEVPITLTEVTATLIAPDIVKLGETITITWTGPNYRGDYIGIGRADAEGGARWQDYERTENGSPLMMDAPDEPGAYVIRYFIDQDNRVIASRPLMVQQ